MIFKKSWTNKLIIMLIIILLFNFIFSPNVKAWDFAGILMKPFTSLILAHLVSIDVQIGLFLNGLGVVAEGVGAIVELITDKPDDAKEDFSEVFSKLFIGPDTIFAGNVPMLNANIFKAESISTILTLDELKTLNTEKISDALSPGSGMITKTRQAIAKVYLILRNICAYIMLAGLIFVGIRVLVTSNMPNKKADWLAAVQDWLIGMILLIFSHVIMVGVFYISDLLVDSLAKSLNGFGSINFSLTVDCLTSFDSATQIINLIMLVYLMYLTIVFAISYFKRFMWVCVLTVIAPIVSIMYGFGKSNSRIYSEWLREYITTVLVQPFHMIVYYVLVMIPINMSSSGLMPSLSALNTFDIIYSLAAISFIKPAERYIRGLFGMNKGLVNMASYDSGKQTLDKGVKAVATVAVTAATAGVGGAAMTAVKGGQLIKSASNAAKALLPNGKTGQFLGKGVDKLEGKALRLNNKKFGLSDAIDAGVSPSNNTNTNQNTNQDTKQDANQNMNVNDDDNTYLNQENNSKEQTNKDTGIDNNTQINDSLSENNSKNDSDNVTSDNINANNVTITAGNVNMQGGRNDDSIQNNNDNSIKIIDAEEEEGKSTEEGEKNAQENENGQEKSNDEIIIHQGKEKRTLKDKAIDGINEGAGRMSNFMKLATGQQGVFNTISNINPNSKLEKAINELLDNDLGDALKNFENLGGFQQLHEGFNELRDTFDPNANGDWKTTNERLQGNQKERIENEKYKFVNNEGNKKYMFNIMYQKHGEKLRNQNPTKNDAWIQNECKKLADNELKSLSDIYVPLGVTNAQIAYECENDRKQYGTMPSEAIRQKMDFEVNLNRNPNVLIELDNKLGGNPETVTEKVDDARTYYQAGYKNVDEVLWLGKLQKALKKDPEYVVQLDKELKKKDGKIEYKGNDKAMKDTINQINEHYHKK